MPDQRWRPTEFVVSTEKTRNWIAETANQKLWLLGAHGGAGVTTLQRCGLAAVDCYRQWPRLLTEQGQHDPDLPAPVVAIVARTSISGLEAAQRYSRDSLQTGPLVNLGNVLVNSWVHLAGLILVADAPGRLPRRIRDYAEQVGAGFPRVWRIPWVGEFRLAAKNEELFAPPQVQDLAAELQHITTNNIYTERDCNAYL